MTRLITLGSVPCACVLVSPLYYKPNVNENNMAISYMRSVPIISR